MGRGSSHGILFPIGQGSPGADGPPGRDGAPGVKVNICAVGLGGHPVEPKRSARGSGWESESGVTLEGPSFLASSEPFFSEPETSLLTG